MTVTCNMTSVQPVAPTTGPAGAAVTRRYGDEAGTERALSGRGWTSGQGHDKRGARAYQLSRVRRTFSILMKKNLVSSVYIFEI